MDNIVQEHELLSIDLLEQNLEYIYNFLNYKPTKEEKEKHKHEFIITINQKLITEKILNKNNITSDNYNLGNYYIGKEKEAEVNYINYPQFFIKKYMTNEDKKLLEYLKNQNTSLDKINKYFIIYNNIKLQQINMSMHKSNSEYVID